MRIASNIAILFLIIIFLIPFPIATSDSWPMFCRDAQNTGNSTSTGPVTNTVLWTVPNIGGNGYSSPAVANGRFFINRGGSGILYCLYETNGTEIWNTAIGIAGQVCSSPAIYDGKVYIVGDMVYCFYENNGTEVWTKSVSGMGVGTSSPTVSDGIVYLNTQNLYCLYAENGTEIWSMYVGGDMQSSTPAVSNGRLFVNADKLACYYANNGTEIWNRTGMESTSPLVAKGKVYWNPSQTYCLYESNGTEIYELLYGGDDYSSPAIYYDRLFLNEGGTIYCLFENNGTIIWQTTIAGSGCSTPAVDAQGNIYLTGGSYAYCLNGTNGNEIWSELTGGDGWSSAAISNGRVFVNQGDIYCFGTIPYTIDYIQIRDAPDGGGNDLCNPANYQIYPIGHTTTYYAAAYNSSAPDDGYLGEVPFALDWSSSNDSIVTVSPTGIFSTISASFTNWGTITITLNDDQGHSNTTQITILEPTVDYVLIRDSPDGGGKNLCDLGNYPTYPLAFGATFYGAKYNYTVGFLGDVSPSAIWNSDNTSLVTVTTPGESSVISCSAINNGTAIITLDSGGGKTNTTQITVLDAQIDYIQIRNAPGGGGDNLCEAGNYPIFWVGHTATFYAAAYNGSDFLSDIPVLWSSTNDSLVSVTTYGESTQIECSETQFGSVSILADYSFGLAESTIITILPPTIDYIMIRDESQGEGSNLCDHTNYPSFPVGSNLTLFGARYNVTSGYLDEVPISSTWISLNDSLVGVTAVGTSTQITCSETNYGTVTITLSDGEGHMNSTQVSVLEPTVDYIQIRDASGNLGNTTVSVHFKLGEVITDTFYCAAYNHTAGYIGERAAQWWLDVDLGTLFPQMGIYTNFSATTRGTGNLSANLNGLIYTIIINVDPEDVIVTLDPPTGLSVQQVEGGGALKLSWDSYNISDFAGFRIYRSSDGGFSFELINPGGLIKNNSYLDLGLTNDVTYHYYITALDNTSNESPSSSIEYNTPKGGQKEDEQDSIWILPIFVIILIVMILLFLLLIKRKKDKTPTGESSEMENKNLPNEDEEPPLESEAEPPLDDEKIYSEDNENLELLEDEI